MSPLDFLLHLMGFAAPAAFLALLLPAVSRGVLGKAAGGYWRSAAIVFVVGLGVLLAGLWGFGRDGKMVTYAALVAAAATAQWLAARAWK
jgi:hypothetical protein